jgi:hypothetical protein
VDPVYHNIYPGDYLVWMGLPTRFGAWAISPSCGMGDRATLCRPPGNLGSWLIYRNEFLSGHWPASGVGGHNFGYHVCGSFNFPHDQLSVVPCLGVPETAGRRAVVVLDRTLGY